MSNKDNTIFQKTSFLQGINSPFIKELYLKYLENPKSIPESWLEFFDGLNEDQDIIKKEILGPSWAPKKNNNLNFDTKEKKTDLDHKTSTNGEINSEKISEKEAENLIGKTLVTNQTGANGRKVSRLYVEEVSEINKEFYLSCLVDRASSKITFISSDQGGMDIEEVAKKNPEKIITTKVEFRSQISEVDCKKI